MDSFIILSITSSYNRAEREGEEGGSKDGGEGEVREERRG